MQINFIVCKYYIVARFLFFIMRQQFNWIMQDRFRFGQFYGSILFCRPFNETCYYETAEFSTLISRKQIAGASWIVLLFSQDYESG